MADSGQDTQVDNSFDDDLDRMLQDTADQVEGDQAILDSDDAIDQLLGDTQGVATSEAENVDDLVDSLLDGVISEQEKTSNDEDEFAEDDSVDDLLRDVQQPEEMDEFAEIEDEVEMSADDEMSAFADELLAEQESEEAKKPDEPSDDSMAEVDEFSSDESEEDDFLMADFDISADDDEGSGDEFTEEVAVAEPPPEPVVEKLEPVPAEAAAAPVAPPVSASVAPVQQQAQVASVDNPASGVVVADLAKLKQELEDLSKTVKEQKRAARIVSEESQSLKMKVIGALAVGGIALIVGIVVLVLNSGVQSDLEGTQISVMDIEDRLEVSAVNPNDEKIEKIGLSLESVMKVVNDLPERLNALQGQVNDIDEQNSKELGEQLLIVSEKITAIEAKLASLSARAAKKTRSVKKAKKVAATKEWVVNLVSFKQRWYTDKKVDEFKKKGVPAEAVPIDIKGSEWYRVRVSGFKVKADAAAYALKMKKLLNLNSVWVSAK